MEDILPWKTYYHGRHTAMEDIFPWWIQYISGSSYQQIFRQHQITDHLQADTFAIVNMMFDDHV